MGESDPYYTDEHCFRFLDALRERGTINMFGAASVLRDCFDLTRAEARRIHAEWMRTYGQRHPKEADRA